MWWRLHFQGKANLEITGFLFIRNISFLHFRNNINTSRSGSSSIPPFVRSLKFSFTEHNVFQFLAEAILSPSDTVWAHIKIFYKQYLQQALRTIGIQLHGCKGKYRQYYDNVVQLCIQRKSALCHDNVKILITAFEVSPPV